MDAPTVASSAARSARLGMQLAQDLFLLASDSPGVDRQINRIAQAFVDLNLAFASLALALQPGKPVTFDPETCSTITALADRIHPVQEAFHSQLNGGTGSKRNRKLHKIAQLKTLFPGSEAAERLAEIEWMKNTLELVAAVVRLSVLQAHPSTSDAFPAQSCFRPSAEMLASAVIAYVRTNEERRNAVADDDQSDDDEPPSPGPRSLMFAMHAEAAKTTEHAVQPEPSDVAELIAQFIRDRLADTGKAKQTSLPSATVDWLLGKVDAVADPTVQGEDKFTTRSDEKESQPADKDAIDDVYAAPTVSNTGAKRKSKKRAKGVSVPAYDMESSAVPFTAVPEEATAKEEKPKHDVAGDAHDSKHKPAKDGKKSIDAGGGGGETELQSAVALFKNGRSIGYPHAPHARPDSRGSNDSDKMSEYGRYGPSPSFPQPTPPMHPAQGTMINGYFPFPGGPPGAPMTPMPPMPPPGVFEEFPPNMAYFSAPGFPPGYNGPPPQPPPYFNNYGGNFPGYNGPFPDMPPEAGMPRPGEHRYGEPGHPPRHPPPGSVLESPLPHPSQMHPPPQAGGGRPYYQEPYSEEPRRHPIRHPRHNKLRHPESDAGTVRSGTSSTYHRASREEQDAASTLPNIGKDPDMRGRRRAADKERPGPRRKEDGAAGNERRGSKDDPKTNTTNVYSSRSSEPSDSTASSPRAPTPPTPPARSRSPRPYSRSTSANSAAKEVRWGDSEDTDDYSDGRGPRGYSPSMPSVPRPPRSPESMRSMPHPPNAGYYGPPDPYQQQLMPADPYSRHDMDDPAQGMHAPDPFWAASPYMRAPPGPYPPGPPGPGGPGLGPGAGLPRNMGYEQPGPSFGSNAPLNRNWIRGDDMGPGAGVWNVHRDVPDGNANAEPRPRGKRITLRAARKYNDGRARRDNGHEDDGGSDDHPSSPPGAWPENSEN